MSKDANTYAVDWTWQLGSNKGGIFTDYADCGVNIESLLNGVPRHMTHKYTAFSTNILVVPVKRCPRLKLIFTSTILLINISTSEKKHQLWKSTAPKRIKLQLPDWSHFKKFKQIFKMRPIW